MPLDLGKQATSMGNSPADKVAGIMQFDRLMATAEADRAARLAGHKSRFQRLLERLRPQGQDPGGDPYRSSGAPAKPAH